MTRPPQAADDRYPWIALSVVLIGTFMVILDTTIANVVLPKIGTELRVTSGLDWVVTAYLLAVGVSQPTTGWLTDRFGRKRVFTVSLGLFALGSLLVSVAPNLLMVVVFRILQGLGGGLMMPVGLALIYSLFPANKRGTALGIWGIAAMAAPAVGPVLGGWIATDMSWRLVFLINVPIGIVGVFAATRLLRDTDVRRTTTFDMRGFAFVAGGLALLLYSFSEATPQPWKSAGSGTAAVVAVVLLLLFVRQERRVEHPLIAIEMFTIPTFVITIGIVWLMTTAQFARLVLIPLELETIRGLTAFQAGLALAPAALGTAAGMPIGGRLADRIGSRTPVVAGLAIIGIAVWLLSHLSPGDSVAYITGVLTFQGVGFGLAIMPNTVAAMNSVPSRLVDQAAAMRSVNRQVAGSIGVAVLATVVASAIGQLSAVGISPVEAQNAYNHAYLVAFFGIVLAFVLSFFLPGREATHAVQRERQAEADAEHEAAMFVGE